MTPAPGNSHSTDDARAHAELLNLAAAQADGSITPQAHARLAALLNESPDARAAYLQYRRLHASLEWAAGESETATPHKPHADAKPAPGEASGATPEPKTIPIYRKGYEPKPAMSAAKVRIIYAIAATLLAACGLAIYVYSSSLPHSPIPDPTSPPPVATLIENTGGKLTTPHDYPVEGNDYSAGEYALDAGSAEFMLTNSVNVKLRGETRLHILNDMRASLASGFAAFSCPPHAQGYTVDLPGGVRVIDRGTRFAVRLDADGVTRIHVVSGRIDIALADGRTLGLGEGESAGVDPQSEWFTSSAHAPDTWADFTDARRVVAHASDARVNERGQIKSQSIMAASYDRVGTGGTLEDMTRSSLVYCFKIDRSIDPDWLIDADLRFGFTGTFGKPAFAVAVDALEIRTDPAPLSTDSAVEGTLVQSAVVTADSPTGAVSLDDEARRRLVRFIRTAIVSSQSDSDTYLAIRLRPSFADDANREITDRQGYHFTFSEDAPSGATPPTLTLRGLD